MLEHQLNSKILKILKFFFKKLHWIIIYFLNNQVKIQKHELNSNTSKIGLIIIFKYVYWIIKC